MSRFLNFYKSGMFFTGTFVFGSNFIMGFNNASPNLKDREYLNIVSRSLLKGMTEGILFPKYFIELSARSYKAYQTRNIEWIKPMFIPELCPEKYRLIKDCSHDGNDSCYICDIDFDRKLREKINKIHKE